MVQIMMIVFGDGSKLFAPLYWDAQTRRGRSGPEDLTEKKHPYYYLDCIAREQRLGAIKGIATPCMKRYLF